MNAMNHIQAAPPGFDLGARAMLVRLSIRGWSARKLDKGATRAAIESHGAADNAGRFNKCLIAADSLAEIGVIGREARRWHESQTLPWDSDGFRLLPVAAFERYSDGMRERREAYEAAVSAFIAAYPTLREDARESLGSMFNPADYPGHNAIAEKFSFAVKPATIGTAADFRLEVSREAAAALRAQVESDGRESVAAAMRDAWSRLHDAVAHMAAKLAEDRDGKPGIFRDSLVGNLRELVEILPGLNLTGDPALADMVERVRDKLTGADADDLRKDAACRKAVADEAAAIADAMGAFMGT